MTHLSGCLPGFDRVWVLSGCQEGFIGLSEPEPRKEKAFVQFREEKDIQRHLPQKLGLYGCLELSIQPFVVFFHILRLSVQNSDLGFCTP